MTSIYGLTEGGVKKTGRDPKVLPRSVIYDPELTLTLPIGMTLTSALNAIAHASEGLYAHDGNPIMALMAEEGIRAPPPPCRGWPPTRATSTRAAMRSMRRGCAARCSATSRWACTTSSATRSAARSTCRMPRSTPWSCRMRSPTTRPPRPKRCAGSRRALGPAEATRSAPAGVFDLARAARCTGGAARHRHAGRRPRPGCRLGRAEPVSEPAAARASGDPRVAATCVRRDAARLSRGPFHCDPGQRHALHTDTPFDRSPARAPTSVGR